MTCILPIVLSLWFLLKTLFANIVNESIQYTTIFNGQSVVDCNCWPILFCSWNFCILLCVHTFCAYSYCHSIWSIRNYVVEPNTTNGIDPESSYWMVPQFCSRYNCLMDKRCVNQVSIKCNILAFCRSFVTHSTQSKALQIRKPLMTRIH